MRLENHRVESSATQTRPHNSTFTVQINITTLQSIFHIHEIDSQGTETATVVGH